MIDWNKPLELVLNKTWKVESVTKTYNSVAMYVITATCGPNTETIVVDENGFMFVKPGHTAYQYVMNSPQEKYQIVSTNKTLFVSKEDAEQYVEGWVSKFWNYEIKEVDA